MPGPEALRAIFSSSPPKLAPIVAFTFSIAAQPQLESGCGCRTTARMPVMSGAAGTVPV